MTGYVDSHAHLLPGRLARKVRQFFLDNITEGLDLKYPLEHEIVLNSMHEAGIDMVWSLPYAHKAGIAAGLNAASAEAVAQYAAHPVKLIGGATVHPDDTDPAAIINEAIDVYGLKVLKIHCSVGNFRPDDPKMFPIWETVSVRQMPVVAHVGMSVSGRTARQDLEALEQVLQQFPHAPIILAHCGVPALEQALTLLEKYPSLYADLTPVVIELVPLTPQQAETFADRLLLGSDAPNTGFYVQQTIAHVKSWQLSAKAEAAILGGNARRLLELVKV